MLKWTAFVTIASLLLYFYMSLQVGKARAATGVKAPATTGDPAFERVFRVHMNTLEWMPIYLPALWMYAFYVSDRWAALIGLVWIAGRVLYMLGYAEAADKRGRGFAIQAGAAGVLLVGALIGILRSFVVLEF